jgi:DNA-binding CsgD family transcriptional regulator
MIFEVCINQIQCAYRLDLAAYAMGDCPMSNGFCPACSAYTFFTCPNCLSIGVTKYLMPKEKKEEAKISPYFREGCCRECDQRVDRLAARCRLERESSQLREEAERKTAQEAAQKVLINATGLSKREIEVLKLIAVGLCNKEISDRLGISLRTVEGIKTRLMLKTRLHSTIHLAHLALENHFVTTNLNITAQVLAVPRIFKPRN